MLCCRCLFFSDVGDLEDVADVSVRRVALGSLLQLVHLLHLQVLNRSDVVHQSHFATAGKLTERAVVRQPRFRDIFVEQGLLHSQQVIEQDGRDLVLLVGHVDLHLVGAVGLELAGVAAEVDRIDARQKPKLPLVFGTSLFDVVDVTQPLKVLVGLAVQLEVGLQVGAVVAKVAEVVAADDDGDLVLPGSAAIVRQVDREIIDVVTAKAAANAAGEQILGIRVLGL